MIHTHLGTILIIRQHTFGLFLTHPICQHNYNTEYQQQLPFSDPTQPSPFADVI